MERKRTLRPSFLCWHLFQWSKFSVDYLLCQGKSIMSKHVHMFMAKNLFTILDKMYLVRMRKKIYPSDMSRVKFESIRPILERARKRTKPATVELYEEWCAVLYLLRTGCQWRALPSDFPQWRTVYSYFAKWSEVKDQEVSLLAQALKKSGWCGPQETGAQRMQ